jgi:3-phosphoglycerate kinase
MKQIPLLTWPLTNKRVFVRADLNTELTAPDFPQSLKFQRLLPTLEYIKKARARILIRQDFRASIARLKIFRRCSIITMI